MIKVKDKEELRTIICKKLIPLQTIDVSNITDMSELFLNLDTINGYIENWSTNQVTNMNYMFSGSSIQPNISNWDVSSVETMVSMFADSEFSQDISNWNISNVNDISYMFRNSEFNQPIGSWNLENKDIEDIFKDSPYSMDLYKKDRKSYLDNLELEKEKINKENLLKETKIINESLNKEVELTTIEMEF